MDIVGKGGNHFQTIEIFCDNIKKCIMIWVWLVDDINVRVEVGI